MDSVAFVGPMDRVLLLRTMPLFEGLGPVQLAAIGQHARERFVEKGARMTIGRRSGDPVMLIVDGEIEVVSGGSRRRCRRGEAAGFVEMLGTRDAPIVLEALSDTMTLELDWEAQIDVCEEHFAVVMRYIGFLAAELLGQAPVPESQQPGPVALIAAQAFGETLDLNERLLLLSRSRALSPRCLDALAELAHHAEELSFEAGQAVWSVDGAADHFLLLASGVLVERDRDGNRHCYGAGHAAGIEEALARALRRGDLAATESSLALRIPLEPFIDILEDHFDLSLDVLSTLADRLLARSRAG